MKLQKIKVLNNKFLLALFVGIAQTKNKVVKELVPWADIKILAKVWDPEIRISDLKKLTHLKG